MFLYSGISNKPQLSKASLSSADAPTQIPDPVSSFTSSSTAFVTSTAPHLSSIPSATPTQGQAATPSSADISRQVHTYSDFYTIVIDTPFSSRYFGMMSGFFMFFRKVTCDLNS